MPLKIIRNDIVKMNTDNDVAPQRREDLQMNEKMLDFFKQYSDEFDVLEIKECSEGIVVKTSIGVAVFNEEGEAIYSDLFMRKLI